MDPGTVDKDCLDGFWQLHQSVKEKDEKKFKTDVNPVHLVWLQNRRILFSSFTNTK